jgi:hypothetical protein
MTDRDHVHPLPALLSGPGLPPDFESEEQPRVVDKRRARDLRTTRMADAVELADLIDPLAPPRHLTEPPASLASARYFRRVRVAFYNEVDLAFAVIPEDPQLCLMTIVPPRWAVSLGQLHTFDIQRHLGTFKMQLHRALAGMEAGPLVAAVSAEVDTKLKFYQPHIHAIMPIRLAQVIEMALRPHEAYAPTAHVKRPIHIIGLDERGRGGAITYLLKSYWPMRNRYVSAKTGELTRSRLEQPLKPAVLAEVLLWLDRRRVGHLIYERGANLSQSLRRM